MYKFVKKNWQSRFNLVGKSIFLISKRPFSERFGDITLKSNLIVFVADGVHVNIKTRLIEIPELNVRKTCGSRWFMTAV